VGFTFSWFPVACKEGFWEEAFDVLQMGREQQDCFSVVSAVCWLPAQTYDQTICLHTSHLFPSPSRIVVQDREKLFAARNTEWLSLWRSEFLFHYLNKMGDVHINVKLWRVTVATVARKCNSAVCISHMQKEIV
jgi:hypothetical protein